MTSREYHDLLVRTSLAGGFPVVDADGECRFRTPDGRKDPIGLLVPDDWLEWRMNDTAEDLLRHFPRVVPEGMGVGDLVAVLRCHDRQAEAPGHPWDHEQFVRDIEPLFQGSDR